MGLYKWNGILQAASKGGHLNILELCKERGYIFSFSAIISEAQKFYQ